jgi:DNA-binding transcriptional LysR family regulator
MCAQSKQVTRAAELIGISQPSLSQQLKLFEEELGFELFVRSSRALELTPRGKVLFEKSVGLFRNAEDILSFVEEKTCITSTYKVLVSDQIDRPFIAEVIGKLLKANHQQNRYFQVISKPHNEITEILGACEYDLLITNNKIRNLKPLNIFNLPVSFITSKSIHEIQQFSDKNIRGIVTSLGEKLVLPSKELRLRTDIDSFLRKEEINTDIVFESNIIACTVRAIKEGVGCGFMPLPYIAHDIKRDQLSVIGPPGGYWEHSLYFYKCLKSDLEDPISLKIGQILRSYY